MYLQVKLNDTFVPKADPEKRKQSEMEFDTKAKYFKDRVALMAIAYHNLAIELEFLNEVDDVS